MSANKKSTNITGVATHADSDMGGESGQGKATGQLGVKVISESPEQKIARLERELRDARLRADFYEEMINVAERRFDIRIRKKAGAKQ